MAKIKPSKKKVISTKTTSKAITNTSNPNKKNKIRIRKSSRSKTVDLPFGKKNFQLIALGAALILIGMLLMTGGGMPSPDIWDESIIYSFRRITLAPLVIVVGLIVEIFAIFKY